METLFFSFLCTQWWVSCRSCFFLLILQLQTLIYSNSSSSIECPKKKKKKKSGTGVNSSNVDKRTRLIPCRCVCDLCEGNTVLPSLERKSTLHTGESSMNYEQKNTSDPVQLVLTACLVFQRSEKRQHRDTSISLSGGTVGMQNHRGVC